MATKKKLLEAAAGARLTPDTGDPEFANVVLLLDGDGTSGDNNNTFTDSSTNGFTVTETGSVVQGSFSPYGDNWSVFFDGVNDHIGLPANSNYTFGTADFTIESWIFTDGSDFFSVWQNCPVQSVAGSSDYYFGVSDSGKLAFGRHGVGSSSLASSSGAVNNNEWTHIAVTRTSSVLTLWVNGTSVATSTDSGLTAFNITQQEAHTIGYRVTPNYGGGYLSNLRVLNGTALYTSSFTPPTEPLSAITNTVFLGLQSNRFIDNSTVENTVSPGGVKVTPFSPFKNDDARDITTDGGSANFNQDDLLTIAYSSSLDVSGAMTAEAWIYVNDFPDGNVGATGQGFVLSRWVASGSQRSWGIFLGNNGQTSFYTSASGGSSYTISSSATGAIKQHQWHHVAVSWDGSNQRLFIDGDLKVTTSNASGPFSTASAPFCTNALNTNLTGSNMDMYIADARYFSDRAIYTENFTLPTEPLGNIQGIANTLTAPVYESKTFSFSGQEANTQGVAFKADGTKMYVVGTATDAVYQYSLSTAWDVSTASYDSVSLDVSTEDTIPYGLAFSTNGEKLYIVGDSNNKIYQYNLSTAWDLSTASYSNNSLSTQGGNPIGVFVHSSGTSIYDVDTTDDKVYQYNMTTAYDLSTASYASKSASVGGNAHGVAFSADGTKMFVCRQSTGIDLVEQYTLSTAWDVSTASSDNLDFDVSSESVNPSDIQLKPDGTKLYMLTNAADNIYQYSLTDSYNPAVMLNFQDAGIYDLSGINNLDTVGDARLGFAPIYGTGSLAFDGTGDYLEPIATSSELALGTGDFTIEFWMNPSSVDATIRAVLSNRYDGASNNVFACAFDNGTGTYGFGIYFHTQATGVMSTGVSPTVNTWQHLAFVRSNGTLYIYKDGTSIGTPTSFTGDLSYTVPPLIGKDGVRTGGGTASNFVGYLDDLRITKGVARYTSNFTPPTEIDLALDTHAENVVFFLDGDGTPNGQNNTFTDSSTNGFTVTESGSVVQGVFSPYGDNWSNSFDGNSDALTIADSADFDFGTGDFTMEAWVYPRAFTGNYNQNNIISAHEGTDNTAYSFAVYSDGKLQLYGGGGNNDYSTSTVSLNEWTHVMVTRSSGTVRFFINGTLDASTYTRTGNYNCTAQGLAIGKQPIDNGGAGATRYWNGWLSNVRMVKGTALQTSSFTPSTSPLTAVTNTVLLACQSNRFVDNSSSSHTLTPIGTASVTRFSPFESNKPYDITTDGGSAYFDGSSHYLNATGGSPTQMGTGAFTWECWCYITATASFQCLIDTRPTPSSGSSTGMALLINNASYTPIAATTGTILTSSINVTPNAWNHVALTRSSGGTLTIWVNGQSGGNTSNSSNLTDTALWVGGNSSSPYPAPFNGYITDARITKGADLYTTAFSSPTAPLSTTVSSGTVGYLLNFQDSAIPDLSGLNNIDTVGNAKVGASDPTKYGSNAMQFDGSGDYLRIPWTDELYFANGDWTFEGWFYRTVTSNYCVLFDNGYGSPNTIRSIVIYTDNASSGLIRIAQSENGSTNYDNSLGENLPANTWTHVAIVRNGSTIKCYVNGSNSGTSVTARSLYKSSTRDFFIGIQGDLSSVTTFAGYIDDLRITKGIARYTANFTPPSEALPKF